MVRVTVPLAFLSKATASWWVLPSSRVASTAWIWSPGLSRPDWAAAPRSNTVLTKMGKSPWGLPRPPTMLKPKPSDPRSRTTRVNVGLTSPPVVVELVVAVVATALAVATSGAAAAIGGCCDGSKGRGGGGCVVGVGMRGASVEWLLNKDDDGGGRRRLSSRTGGAGGSRWEGAGLLGKW